MIEPLAARWRQLQGRERRGLIALFLVAGLTALYVLAVEPAWVERERLQRELPALRAQLGQMAALTEEASRLSGAAAQVATGETLVGRLRDSVSREGLESSGFELRLAADRLELRFESVEFVPWLDWLDAVVREIRLRVVELAVNRIEKGDRAGLVSVRLVLQAPGGMP